MDFVRSSSRPPQKNEDEATKTDDVPEESRGRSKNDSKAKAAPDANANEVDSK